MTINTTFDLCLLLVLTTTVIPEHMTNTETSFQFHQFTTQTEPEP